MEEAHPFILRQGPVILCRADSGFALKLKSPDSLMRESGSFDRVAKEELLDRLGFAVRKRVLDDHVDFSAVFPGELTHLLAELAHLAA